MGHEGKVIITCAVTGSIHTPSMSTYLPVTAEEIADAAIGAAEAGAAILHLHARDPETGAARPDRRGVPAVPEGDQAADRRRHQHHDRRRPVDDAGTAAEPARIFSPEVASLNMGSMNFGLFPMLNRYKDFKHDWEPKALEDSRDFVFKNTFADIEYVLTTLRRSTCASNSSATTPAISTPCAISWTAAW